MSDLRWFPQTAWQHYGVLGRSRFSSRSFAVLFMPESACIARSNHEPRSQNGAVHIFGVFWDSLHSPVLIRAPAARCRAVLIRLRTNAHILEWDGLGLVFPPQYCTSSWTIVRPQSHGAHFGIFWTHRSVLGAAKAVLGTVLGFVGRGLLALFGRHRCLPKQHLHRALPHVACLCLPLPMPRNDVHCHAHIQLH